MSHKCPYIGCNSIVNDKYVYCWFHKDEKYKSICKIHGESIFKGGRCVECEKMKRPMYRIHKRANKYYVGNSKKPLPKDSYLMKQGWNRILIHKNRKYAMRFVSRITNTPGIYGIFTRDKRNKHGIGKCLYVGQSVNIKNRVKQHRDNLKEAKRHIISNHKRIPDSNKMNVAKMYYYIAFDYNLEDLKFVRLMSIDRRQWNKLSRIESLELLTFLEQYCMDSWKPKFNKIAARVTNLNNFESKSLFKTDIKCQKG